MVHAKSTIALTVLALGAASTLAAPSYDYSEDLALREFEEIVKALEARGVEFDYNDYDARDFEFDLEDVDARDLEDYDIREIIEEFDVDARELGYGDYDLEFERDWEDMEDIVERATSTTSSSSSTTTPSATTTTIISKPTGKTFFGKKKKETKTVVVTTFKTPKHCKKPGLFSRIKNAFKKSAKKRSQLRHEKKNGKSSSSTTSSSSHSATSTSASSTSSATATASSTHTANWSQITPPPRKERHGAEYSQKKKVGKDKVTTISRTVTAAATPCPSKDAKKHKRDLEEIESIFEREYSFDQLD